MPVSKIKGLGLGPYRSVLIWALICLLLISPIEKVSAEVLNPKLLDIVVLQAAGKVSGKPNSDLVNGIVSARRKSLQTFGSCNLDQLLG